MIYRKFASHRFQNLLLKMSMQFLTYEMDIHHRGDAARGSSSFLEDSKRMAIAIHYFYFRNSSVDPQENQSPYSVLVSALLILTKTLVPQMVRHHYYLLSQLQLGYLSFQRLHPSNNLGTFFLTAIYSFCDVTSKAPPLTLRSVPFAQSSFNFLLFISPS